MKNNGRYQASDGGYNIRGKLLSPAASLNLIQRGAEMEKLKEMVEGHGASGWVVITRAIDDEDVEWVDADDEMLTAYGNTEMRNYNDGDVDDDYIDAFRGFYINDRNPLYIGTTSDGRTILF